MHFLFFIFDPSQKAIRRQNNELLFHPHFSIKDFENTAVIICTNINNRAAKAIRPSQ